jgi:hypothetical protein
MKVNAKAHKSINVINPIVSITVFNSPFLNINNFLLLISLPKNKLTSHL